MFTVERFEISSIVKSFFVLIAEKREKTLILSKLLWRTQNFFHSIVYVTDSYQTGLFRDCTCKCLDHSWLRLKNARYISILYFILVKNGKNLRGLSVSFYISLRNKRYDLKLKLNLFKFYFLRTRRKIRATMTAPATAAVTPTPTTVRSEKPTWTGGGGGCACCGGW